MSKEKPATKKFWKNDIRYRGIFTYRGLRMFALILMTLSQVAQVFLTTELVVSVVGVSLLTEAQFVGLGAVRMLGQSSFVLLLIASVGIILNKQESYKRMLITYFIMAVVAYLATVFILAGVVERMLYGLPAYIPQLEKYL